MRKSIFYSFILILFLGVYSNVFADSFDYEMGKGEEVSLDFYDYSGVSCDDSGLYYLKYTPVSSEVGKITYKLSTYPDRDNYFETMICTFDYELANPSSGPGRLEYTFNIRPSEVSLNFDLIKNKHDFVNLFTPVSGYEDFTELVPDLKKVISLKDNTSQPRTANRYIKTDCPAESTTKCNFKLDSSFPESYTDGKEANYILNYENDSGDFLKMYIDITAFPSQYLYASYGGYGVCSFGSGWINSDAEFVKKHQMVVGNTITLPNCDASKSSNPFLEFAGWVDVSGGAGGADAIATDLCVSYLLPSKTVTVTDETRDFSACYKRSNGIVLNLNGGEFSLPRGTIELDDLYYIKSTSSVTLPSVTKVPEAFTVDDEEGIFVGWEDEDGVQYDAGDTVPADGTLYNAVFQEKYDDVVDDLLYTKMVFYNNSEALQVDGTVKSCTSADTAYVTTTISGNECMVFGVKDTGGKLINVLVKLSDDTIITYKVSVIESDSEFSFDDIIDLGPLEDYDVVDVEAMDVDIYGTSTCNKYTVTNIKDDVPAFATNKSNSLPLAISRYEAKSECDGSKHLALCMDPGKKGPSGTVYVLDTSFNADSEFAKMIKHLVKVLAAEGQDDTNVAAANIALRLIQYYSPEEKSGYVDSLAGYYVAYKNAGNKLRSNSYCGTDIEGCSSETIKKALKATWTWSNTAILDKTVYFLSSFETTTATPAALSGVTGTSSIKEINPWNGDGVQIVFDGYANFKNRAQMSGVTIHAYCPTGFSCSIHPWYTYQSGTRWYYRYELYVPASSAQKYANLTTSPAVEFRVANGSITAANVFVLKNRDSENRQRMATFNVENAKVRINLQGANSCSVLQGFSNNMSHWRVPDVLDPESSSFNPALFKALGCCEVISGSPRYYDEYDYTCSNYCYSSNFRFYCNPSKKAGDHQGGKEAFESYSIKEAYVDRGDKANAKSNFTCVVDVTNNATTSRNNTVSKYDFAGNKYTVKETEANPYCVVSCREEWDISVPSFNTFVGKDAVLAGSYFSINDPIFIGTKKQCYTSYIDYSSYVTKQQEISSKLVTDFNIHSEFTKVYESINKSANKNTRVVYYKKWHIASRFACHTSHCRRYGRKCSTNSKGKTTCRSYCAYRSACTYSEHPCHSWYYTEHKCTLYTVQKESSPSFNAYTYSSTNSGSGDSLVKNGSVTFGSKYASNGLYATGDSRVVRNSYNSNMLESNYTVGSRPNRTTQDPYSFNGKCCGKEAYKCTTANHAAIINAAGYTSRNYGGASGKITTVIANKNAAIKASRASLTKNAQNMSKCQNFYLTTEGSSGSSFNNYHVNYSTTYNGSNSNKLFSQKLTSSAPTQRIDTTFDPKASYEYEEYYFMGMLAGESGGAANVIRPVSSAKELKELAPGITYPSPGQCVNINRTGQYNVIGTTNKEQLQLCRQKTTTAAYNPSNSNPWRNNVEGRTYSGGTNYGKANGNIDNVATINIPICDAPTSGTYNNSLNCVIAQTSVYKVHYITKTLQNSNFFVNKGHWYVDEASDVKLHGDNKAAAISNSKNDNFKNLTTEQKKMINLLGQKYNVFPVSLNTPKNYYQYKYSFKDIGHFPETGNLGRIMGTNISLLEKNYTSCFYEVVEDLCTCCGDPIVFYTYETSKIDSTETFLGTIGFKPSDGTKSGEKDASLNITNTTIPLFDSNVNANDLGSNWSSNDVFSYKGELYLTNKGIKVYKAIMEKGETIYDVTKSNPPEYSYMLNAEAMSKVKEYNKTNRYGFSNDTVRIIGRKICFDSTATCTNNVNDEEPGYFHFGSNFLNKDFMVKAITPEYKNKLKTAKSGAYDENCFISDSLADTAFKNQLNSKTSCRWVDVRVNGPSGKKINLALK